MKKLLIVSLFYLACETNTTPLQDAGFDASDVQTKNDLSAKDTFSDPNSMDVNHDSRSSDLGLDVEKDSDQSPPSKIIFEEQFSTDVDYKNEPREWTLLNAARSTVVGAMNGFLTIVPEPTNNNAWYELNQSSLLYRTIEGDFIVEASVKVSTYDGNDAPAVGYNSAGFVVRDSTSNSENWIMYNIGAQSDQVPFGVEVKTTTNASSILELFPLDSGDLTRELRICRLGNSFRYFQRESGGQEWTETLPSSPHQRDDFPAAIDVGLMSGTWTGSEVQGTFDWISAWQPENCLENKPE